MATKKKATASKKTPAPTDPDKPKKSIVHDVAAALVKPNAIPPAPEPPKDKPIVTHFIFVLDDSSSCHALQPKLIALFNDQLNMIKAKAHEAQQEAFVSVYAFADGVRPFYQNVYYQAARPITNFDLTCRGSSTALLDGAARGIVDHIDKIKNVDKDVSCLLIVLTDGEENSSRINQPPNLRDNFDRLIKEAQGTDRWTISFLVPHEMGKRKLVVAGVPPGNIALWEVSEQGAEVASQRLSASIGDYVQVRASGQKRSTAFFVDMSTVSKTDLDKLTDVSGTFHRWEVTSEADISTFVDEQLSTRSIGGKYMIGAGFYQLTKPEKLQAHKAIMVYDKKSRKLYGGQEARSLLGVQSNGEIKIKPENLATFEVYVQSTSSNRKLVRGSHLLYDKAIAKAKAAAV